jgi:hypothetical protein
MTKRTADELQADQLKTITRAQGKLIDAAAAIMLDPEPTDADRAFLARQLVQVTLPYSNSGASRSDRDANGQPVELGNRLDGAFDPGPAPDLGTHEFVQHDMPVLGGLLLP